MIIQRKIFREIEKYLESRQVIVVTGMRRVGKTTLLQYFFEKIPSKNKIFLDLEDPLNRQIFNPNSYEQIKFAFMRRGIDFSQKAYIFLDEIQFVPKIPSLVKYLYDHYSPKFFLTGSASFYLKNLFSESLAGRKYLFELYPLDFAEFLFFKNSNYKLPNFWEKADKPTYELFSPLVEEYLFWGGMPEVALVENPQEKEAILKDIFSSYFQKEIQTLGDFRKNEVLQNLILLLAKRTGQKIDIQRVSRELGVSRQTVYEYLDFLCGTYLISLLPCLGEIDIRTRKQKKVYLVDQGLFRILEKPPLGSIFENVVFNHLKTQTEVFYYSKKNQEIDFIAKTPNGEKFAFEVKETATIGDVKRIKKLGQKLGIKNNFVISLNYCPDPEVKYLFQISNLKMKS